MHTSKRLESGLTLLEVLVAMAIFAIGLLGVVALQTTAMQGNATSIKMTRAVQLAGEQIESLLTLDYDNGLLVDTSGNGEGDLNAHAAGSADHSRLGVRAGEVGPTYDIFWNTADDMFMTNTKTIRVIVAWQEEGRTKRVSMDHIKRR
jgi:type IV pilus assembly protein PilV